MGLLVKDRVRVRVRIRVRIRIMIMIMIMIRVSFLLQCNNLLATILV